MELLKSVQGVYRYRRIASRHVGKLRTVEVNKLPDKAAVAAEHTVSGRSPPTGGGQLQVSAATARAPGPCRRSTKGRGARKVLCQKVMNCVTTVSRPGKMRRGRPRHRFQPSQKELEDCAVACACVMLHHVMFICEDAIAIFFPNGGFRYPQSSAIKVDCSPPLPMMLFTTLLLSAFAAGYHLPEPPIAVKKNS